MYEKNMVVTSQVDDLKVFRAQLVNDMTKIIQL